MHWAINTATQINEILAFSYNYPIARFAPRLQPPSIFSNNCKHLRKFQFIFLKIPTINFSFSKITVWSSKLTNVGKLISYTKKSLCSSNFSTKETSQDNYSTQESNSYSKYKRGLPFTRRVYAHCRIKKY